MANSVETKDTEYLQIILECVRVSATYRPKFGRGGGGLTLQEFQELYGGDPFYSWFGLDNAMLYAAHTAAGGMTSIYRQIGIGCEKMFRKILQDEFDLSDEDTKWSYDVPANNGGTRRLSLDGRLPLARIGDTAARRRVREWMRRSAEVVGVTPGVFQSLTGAVFEVRQGYKSKDSKRQNADIANASSAYVKSYLPCVIVLSNQIDEDVLRRYRAARWVVTTGTRGSDDPLTSTYGFLREVVGYDLAAFFERNAAALQSEVSRVLEALLSSGRT